MGQSKNLESSSKINKAVVRNPFLVLLHMAAPDELESNRTFHSTEADSKLLDEVSERFLQSCTEQTKELGRKGNQRTDPITPSAVSALSPVG